MCSCGFETSHLHTQLLLFSVLASPPSALLLWGGLHVGNGLDALGSLLWWLKLCTRQTFLGVVKHYLENSNHSGEEKVTHLEHLENSKHLKWGQMAVTAF